MTLEREQLPAADVGAIGHAFRVAVCAGISFRRDYALSPSPMRFTAVDNIKAAKPIRSNR